MKRHSYRLRLVDIIIWWGVDAHFEVGRDSGSLSMVFTDGSGVEKVRYFPKSLRSLEIARRIWRRGRGGGDGVLLVSRTGNS